MIDLEHLNQARILALKLSTLSSEDYEWVQDHASEEALNKLNPLVEEIRQLGFELQYSELIELLQLSSKNDAARQKSQHELINDLQFDDLLRLFKNETDTLLPIFSTLDDWQWKNSPKFIEYRKRRGHQFIDGWGERPLLKEALLNIIGDTLLAEEHSPANHGTSHKAALSEVLKLRVRHLIGKFKRESTFK